MSVTWLVVLISSAGAYLIKLAGYLVPPPVLAHPMVRRTSHLLPVALLAALVAVQTLGSGPQLVLDARLAGVAAAVVALLLRARPASPGLELIASVEQVRESHGEARPSGHLPDGEEDPGHE